MAFTVSNVNYASDYSKALSGAYPAISHFAEIWGGAASRRYKEGMGRTMYIPTLTVKGSVPVDRDQVSGAFARNWNNAFTPVTLEMDREWDTLIDPMDMDETGEVATIANVTRTFNERQKLPEMDAYLAMKLYSFVTPDTTALSAGNILTVWDGYLESLTNARVSAERAVAYMTPGAYRLLKNAAGLTRFVDVTGGKKSVNRNVASLDGVTIHEVPADLMKSAYTFTEGYAPQASAKQINMILLDPMAVAAPVKYETSMISAPTAQSRGKYLYYERYYYGAFMLPGCAGSVIVNADA